MARYSETPMACLLRNQVARGDGLLDAICQLLRRIARRYVGYNHTFPHVITVPSGMVGVLWKRFNSYDLYCWCFVGRGTIVDPRELRDEGLHVIWPWDKLYLYNLRLQSNNQTYNAITKDGVSVSAQINIRFQLLHNYVAVLHKFIGPDYLVSVVDPEIGSRAREVIAQYTAQEVYTSREAIQDKIRNEAQKAWALTSMSGSA